MNVDQQSYYGVKEPYTIVDSTKEFNYNEVNLKKMLVPCDAAVSYRIENGTKTAKRIDIKRVTANASWQWIAEQPE